MVPLCLIRWEKQVNTSKLLEFKHKKTAGLMGFVWGTTTEHLWNELEN